MNTSFISRKLFVLVAVLILMAVSIDAKAIAQESIEGGASSIQGGETIEAEISADPVPGGPGFIMVHPTEFIPMSDQGKWQIGGGGYIYNPGTIDTYYEAPVNLPHGATITKMVVYFRDSSVTKDLWAALAKINMDTGAYAQIGYVESTESSVDLQVLEDITISQPIIDNKSNGYWLEISLPGEVSNDLRLRGIRIDYAYAVSLPLVSK